MPNQQAMTDVRVMINAVLTSNRDEL